MLSNRENFIKKIFLPDNRNLSKTHLSEEEVDVLVKKISEIGDSIGFVGNSFSKDDNKNNKRKHKYDVWIAKEVKKNPLLINKIPEIRLIIDWVLSNKINIFEYSFDLALEKQKEWHVHMFAKHNLEEISIPEIEQSRIVFRCSNSNYFIYLLSEKELNYEGKCMGHCIGQDFYRKKIKNKQSLILSLRDIKNQPHVTIEIDVKRGEVLQQYSKGNTVPPKKYIKLLHEFAFFYSNYPELQNKEILKFLNINLF